MLLSPLNLMLGAVVGLLAGCNVAVAAHDATCRRGGYGRLVGVLPAFLLGIACCVPTLLLASGTGTAAALIPFVLPLRRVFYPLTFALLLAAVVWGSHRASGARP